jgi:hypothetical protein
MGWVLSILVLLLLFGLVMFLKRPALLLISGNKSKGVVVAIKTNGEVKAPVIEFTTVKGEHVKIISPTSTPDPSIRIGDQVTVAYKPSAPQDALPLMFRELTLAWWILGFIAFILLIWISALLMAPEGGLDDPFHFLSRMIADLKLSPTRFPLYFMLPIVIFCTGLAAWVTMKDAIELRTAGIKVQGYVTGTEVSSTTLSDHTTAKGEFAVIRYTDAHGAGHTIDRALAKPLSRLKTGDVVEVIYPPKRPDLGVVNTWDEFFVAPLVFTFFFLAFLSMGVLLVLGKIP